MTPITDYIYIADGARILGDVQFGADSSVWYNAVIRGDMSTITIGHHTNIQDNAVLHTEPAYPASIGDYVTIGHGAIVHGCTVGNNTLIGMGAIILNGAKIGSQCIIGAGALVTQNMVIPDCSVVFGSPAKIRRTASPEDIAGITQNALHYVSHAKDELHSEPLPFEATRR